MLLKHLPAAAVLVLSAASARADFSYEQTSKITGGMMAGMMKFAGAFSKQAREPIQTTISVKGDRLSSASAHHINIIDLNAETITDVDLDKKTYAVITFAEMARAMQQMSEKMGDKTGDASLNAKANVKQTGSTRNINGFQTKESVLTIELEGQNNKSGEKGSMTVVTDMWLAPNLPGYDEVKDFYARMGKKLAWTPGMGGMGAMGRQAGMMKGMSQLYQEASKLEGVPVLQIVRMSGMANGMSEADMAKMQEAQAQAQAEQQQNPPPPAPTAGDVAGNAASGAALGRMGKLGGLAGAAGGFGGFGRKKKQQQQEEAPPQQSQPQQAQTPPPAQAAQTPPNGMGPTPPGTLIEMTTELTAFSSAPVDSAKMNVPDGFKQVDHEMKKALK